MQDRFCARGLSLSVPDSGCVALVQVTDSLDQLANIVVAEGGLHGGQRRIGKEWPVQSVMCGLQGQNGARS